MASKSVKKRLIKQAGITAVDLQQPKRYSIQSDNDGHEYFVEVGMEGEFESWVAAEEAYEQVGYECYKGHDYEENRIDGRFTFTDPRCE